MAEVSTLDAVQLLRGAFPRQSFNRESEGAYAAGLVDLDPSDVVKAVAYLIRNATALPTVAEIRGLCGAAAGTAPESEDFCPLCGAEEVIVWKARDGRLLQECGRCGAYGLRNTARQMNATGRPPLTHALTTEDLGVALDGLDPKQYARVIEGLRRAPNRIQAAPEVEHMVAELIRVHDGGGRATAEEVALDGDF